MRKFKYILLILVSVLCGCNERIIPVTHETGNGYIFFDTERITRGVPVEDYLQDHFNVIGYEYTGDWATVRPQITQQTPYKVFETLPQVVTYSNSIHKYEPAKEWDESSTYSFFAWYPTSCRLCSPTGADYNEGEPYIKYTLDSDPSEHIDLLTASVIDRRVNLQDASSKSVTLTMKHRLSALDIVARSYVNAASFNITGVTTAKVKITDIDITLGNAEKKLLYDGAIIPLNTNDRGLSTLGTTSNGYTGAVTYNNIASNALIEFYSSSSNLASLTSDAGKTMFLIPQDEQIYANIELTYDIVNEDGTTIWDAVYESIPVGDRPAKTQTQNVTIKKLQEGMRYYILINVTKSGVSVVVLDADAWEDIPPIEYEFE